MEEISFDDFEESAQSLAEISEKKPFKLEFKDIKSEIYTMLFYSFGLFVGSYLYKIAQSDTLNSIIKPENETFVNLFISNFCLYFSVFLLVVFLGFCLIGYPIINIIPSVIGIFSGVKMGYFLINYSVKGISYSLIMIIPHIALFLTAIAYTIKISTDLSKSLMDITKNNEKEFNVKSYIKKYLIMALCIILTALIDAGLSCLLFSVVTI